MKVVDDIYRPLKLYYDNNPAVQYAHNNNLSGAAKYIDINYYVVKDKVHIINFEHVSTEKILVDPLKKKLTTAVGRSIRRSADVRSP